VRGDEALVRRESLDTLRDFSINGLQLFAMAAPRGVGLDQCQFVCIDELVELYTERERERERRLRV
jgi:hypothetical protein